MISALYVTKDSIYKSLSVDCWDEQRNALLFPGNNPVICHPPCRLFSRLHTFSSAPESEKLLAVHAVEMVRYCGGILEHPYPSKLWELISLPLPGKTDKWGGFTMCVNQSWFGHKAEKKTLLYFCGLSKNQIPKVPISFDTIKYIVEKTSTSTHYRKSITKKERNATPENFAKWLIGVCQIIEQNNRCEIVDLLNYTV